MKKFLFVYRKPNKYYDRFISFLMILSFSLVLTINKFNISLNKLYFLLVQYIILFFILLFINIIIESFQKSEKMSPLEIYDIENFVKKVLKKIKTRDKSLLNKINEYNPSKKILKKYIQKKKRFIISSIVKENNKYIVHLIDEKNGFYFLF